MATQRIAFKEWLPDQPTVLDCLTDAKNVVPVAMGYAPMMTAEDISNAASEALSNAFAGKFGTSTELFAGGATKLFKFNPSDIDLDNVSKGGGYTGSNRWNFVQFGDVVLAANGSEKIQSWQVGSSTAFADVAANAPTAKFITVVRDFVVSANIGSDYNKVQWSDINAEGSWTAGGASQADFQLIADGGNILGITGGEFGLVLLEKSVVRMSYSGSPLFFQFDTISRNVGCNAEGSVAQYGNLTFFLSDDGFYQCDGTALTAIGDEKVDNYFYTNVDISKLSKMSCVADPISKLVIWNYFKVDGTTEMLIYNFKLSKWSRADSTADYICSSATSNIALEGLDAFGTIDTLPASLDDRLWAGGQYVFAGVASTKLIAFTGPYMPAKLITNDIEQGYDSVVTLARPMVDNGSASVAVASRKNLNETITYSSDVTATTEGRCSLRSSGRYHRLKLIPSGDNWKHAVGLDIDITTQGTR
jgi:hypothetical protein